MKLYSTASQFYGNVVAAVDVETTGLNPEENEIIQIAVVLLNDDFEPSTEVSPFYTTIKPQRLDNVDPEAMEKNGLSLDDLLLNAPESHQVEEMFVEWFQNLELPENKNLVPMAHNWNFERDFLSAWLGHPLFTQIFRGDGRDTQSMANMLNDVAFWAGNKPPFLNPNLVRLCQLLKIPYDNPHDALPDALACAKVFKRLLQMSVG